MITGMTPWITLLLGVLLTLPPAACCAEAPARGDSVMVASAHPLATSAGLEILRQGGNAVDAAIAVAFALAVCEPYSSGIGGGGFAILFDAANGRVQSLDCRETAPASATRDMYLIDGEPDAELSCYGPRSVAVPGMVRGMWDLHQVAGSLAWQRLLAPAIRLAGGGIPVSPMLRERIRGKAERFDEAARSIFMPGGAVPPVGAVLRQRDLERTLGAIATHGPDAFYRGPVATAIVRACADAHGGVSLSDLAAYRPHWREPVRGRYRHLEVVSMAPPSSGGVHLVQMLNILEGFDLQTPGYGSAAAWHLMTEAMRFAYADRSRFLGDTDFVDVPVKRLTARSYADSLRGRISPDRAIARGQIQGVAMEAAESDETTHLSVVDGQGNAVAATLTINLTFGSGLVAPGTGILLNNEMDDFVAAPGRPNAFGLVGGEANSIAPGKRPLSSMTPTLLLDGGRVVMVTGTPGGSKIITTTLQTVVHVVDFEMDALQAVSVPRIHHQWFPRMLYHEPYGVSPDTGRRLSELGHRLKERSPMCNAQVIVVDPETGVRFGASDPRGMGLSAGY